MVQPVRLAVWPVRLRMRAHLASLVEDFRTHANEVAVVSHIGVRRYATTYGELSEIAGRFSAELQRRGIRPGERVVLWAQNDAAWIGMFFGCVLRGVLVVPLDPASSRAFADRVVHEVTPRLIVADATRIGAVVSNVPRINIAEWKERLPLEPVFEIDPGVNAEAHLQIVFTSGTTAEPKGIVHTHRNVLASLAPIEAEICKYRRYERWAHPLRFLHTLPLSHVFGQFMGLWIPTLLAAEVHFSDVLESPGIVRLSRRERLSVLIAVPRMLILLRSYLLGEYPSLEAEIHTAGKLSIAKRWWRFRRVHRALGWKFWALISGGASLPADLESFWNGLGFALIQGYGMTETAALVTLNHPFRIGRGTIGRALPGREVRLTERGELQVRGQVVANATWQQGSLHTREGDWLATGDLAEQSDKGEFRFLGRIGDAIVSASGMNIYPSDLETALMVQLGVEECAVVDCDLGTGPEAVAVLIFQGDDAAMQEAVNGANATLAEYQRIRRVLRWPELAFPYTSTGKLLKRTIREWACSAFAARSHERQSGDALRSLITSITGEPGAAGGDELQLSEYLHLDSLGRVQLASLLEQQTGLLLGDDQVAALRTLGELRCAVGMDHAPAQSGTSERLQEGQHSAKVEASGASASRSTSSDVYSHWPWWKPTQWLRAIFLEVVMRPLVGALLAPHVDVSGALPEGPLLVIANHITTLDAPLVLYGLPSRLRRRLAIAMSGEMLQDFRRGDGNGVAGVFYGPPVYWLLTALFNVFPLPRLRGFRQSFAHAGEALDRGYSVLVFPEGTRSRTGELASFRQGIGLLSQQARVPVLPVVLEGLEPIRSRRVRWFRSGKLCVRVGGVIAWNETKSPTEWTAELEQAVRSLAAHSACEMQATDANLDGRD